MAKSLEKIHITGIGVRSPCGDTPEAFWKGLIEREKFEKTIPQFKSLGIDDPKGIFISDLPNGLSPKERLLTIGREAVEAAIADWGGTLGDFPHTALILGSGLGYADQIFFDYVHSHPQTPLHGLTEDLADTCHLNAETIYIANSCTASSQAVSFGADLLEFDLFDLVIAGGIDVLSELAYGGFLRLNAVERDCCKPFDKSRKGIMVGEGAVFFVLQRTASLLPRQNKVYGSIAGTGHSGDAYHIVQMEPSGEEIRHSISQAMEMAGTTEEDLELIVAHGTGTVLNDKTESKVLKGFLGETTHQSIVTAPKGALGHTGGASGAFGILTALGALALGIVPPVLNLKEIDPQCDLPLAHPEALYKEIRTAMVNAFGFGGSNVAMILKKNEQV